MIPDSQLVTWANVGATKAAADTYTSIKAALEAAPSLKGLRYEVYLQGSYRNSTNIFGDMDVDILVESRQSFYYDIDRLTEAQQAEFKRWFPGDSDHTFARFRTAVEAAVAGYYSNNLVTLANKCIKVKGKPGRLDADVVPCVQHREYRPNASSALPKPCEGIVFFTRDANRKVVNFPVAHYDKGVDKNKNTCDRFKPTVRIFKNLRNHLVTNDLVGAEAAPSYFVTCLIYNAPNDAFKRGHDHTVLAILQWMHGLTDDDVAKLVSQNGLRWLVRDTPDLWRLADFKSFRLAVIKAWNDWGK
jgi:hypothetical protein